MTFEEMERFDPMDYYDMQVEMTYNDEHNPDGEIKNYKRPFTPILVSTLHKENRKAKVKVNLTPASKLSKVEYDEDGMIIS